MVLRTETRELSVQLCNRDTEDGRGVGTSRNMLPVQCWYQFLPLANIHGKRLQRQQAVLMEVNHPLSIGWLCLQVPSSVLGSSSTSSIEYSCMSPLGRLTPTTTHP